MKTLDHAWDAFERVPTTENAGDYLMAALIYWNDGILSDLSFEDHVARVARHLQGRAS